MTGVMQAETSIHRAKQCSREVAVKHTAALKQCLAKRGIYDLENDCYVKGKEGNVIWMDEMGQFFNYLQVSPRLKAPHHHCKR
jgi:hypothetical protein